MPKEYVAVRDRLASSGTPYDKAQSIAAATYNKRHPKAPMGSGKGYDERKGRPRPLHKLMGIED